MHRITLAASLSVVLAASASADMRQLTPAETRLQEQCFAALEVADKAAKQGDHKSVDHGLAGCGPWEAYVRAHQKSLFGDQGN
jgi:hypothetical protein